MNETVMESSAKVVLDLNEKIRVLHVDDDAALLKIAKQCLEVEVPVQVDTAMSVDEALTKLDKEKYDVVVSDYQMPIRDGLEFLKELREKGDSIPFIVFTGKGREEVAIRALNLGADQYLNKTGDPETVYCELAHAITGVAMHKRAQDEKIYAETALKKCGERYEHLFDSAIDGILINGFDGKISSLNPTAARILGYDSPKELIGKTVVELYFDPETWSRMLKELMDKCSLRDCEMMWKKKDGTLIEILANITVEKDGKGNLLRTEGIFRDVTEEKKAERALAESEQKLRSVVQGSPIPAFYIDKDHKVVYWNGALEKYSGLKAEDVVGTDRHWSAFYPEKRPCMADLVLDEDHEQASKWYPEKHKKSELVDGGLEAIDFFPSIGKNGAWLYFTAVAIRDSKGSLIGALEMLEDITERKKSEEALRVSEEKYRDLFENSKDMKVMFDLSGNITAVNKVAIEYGFKTDAVIGRNMLAFVPETEYPQVHKDVEEILQGKTIEGESEIDTPRGKRIFEHIISPIKKNGEIIGICGSFTDVTEGKKAEMALLESEAKFRELVDFLPEMVFEVDTRGRVVFANRRACELTGYSKQDLDQDFDANRLVAPEDLERSRENMRKMFSGNMRQSSEYVLVKKDGKRFPVSLSSVPIVRDDNIIGLRGIVIDISERKKMEDALRESEERLRATVMDAPIGIATSGPDTRFVSANNAFCMILGYTEDELRGMTFKDITHFEDLKVSIDKMQDLSAGRIPFFSVEKRYVRKDGDVILGKVTVSGALRDQDGRPRLFIAELEDITERKQAEEALQKSERRYRSLANSLPEVVFEADSQGKLTFINEKAFELTGYSWQDFEKGLSVFDLVGPEEQKKMRENFGRRLLGESGATNEYLFLKKGGDTYPVLIKSEPAFNGTSITGVRGIVMDVSLLKKTEDALRKSESQFRLLANNSHDVIWTMDLANNVTYVSPSVFRLRGYTPEEVLKQSITESLTPDSARTILESLKHFHETGAIPSDYVELENLRKDGSTVWTETNFTVLRSKDGKPESILGVTREITKRKKEEEKRSLTEKALVESQQQFRGLFMGNPEAVAYLRSDYRVLDINPRFEELFGYSLDEIKGKHINDIIVPKNMINEAQSLDKQALDGYVYHNTQRQKKNRSMVSVAVSAAPIKVEGKPTGIIAMYKDISDLKAAERKLEKMNEKLQVVGGLTRHDVRNKLSAITGNAYLLKKQLTRDPEILEKLADMEKAVQQVTQIFDFAKTYESLGVEELVYLDLSKIVNEAIAMFPNLNGIEIANRCGGINVLADSLLRQMFFNLIHNSLKHGQKTSKIEIRCEEAGSDELKLYCKDDGVGIPEKIKTNLFKEGFTTGNGSGYGLYLTKKMMEVYGWTIMETGTPENGAQFTITIPRMNQNGRENYFHTERKDKVNNL